MIILTILIVFILILFLWQISNLISIFFGSVYVKSRRDTIIFALKKAGVGKNTIFYELGCGTGDVVLEAQKLGAGKIIGVEISPFYYIIARMRTLRFSKVNLIYGNLKNVNLKNADVVYCYLLPGLLEQLAPKLLKERPKKIISVGFEIRSLPKRRIYHYNKTKIFIYSLSSRSV